MLDLLLRGVENVSLISLEIFLLLLITITLGLQKKILILRWHTLFKMGGKYTKKWFWRLVAFNLIIIALIIITTKRKIANAKRKMSEMQHQENSGQPSLP